MLPFRGPNPDLLPNPIPLLYITPPGDRSVPTFYLDRARRGLRLPVGGVRSPSLLHLGWKPRPTLSLQKDPYAPYIPETLEPSTRPLDIIAMLLTWIVTLLSWELPQPLLPSGEKRRRHRRYPPIAFLVLLFGGTLIISATLHASAYAADTDFEIVDPLLHRVPAVDAGLYPPKTGWIRHVEARSFETAIEGEGEGDGESERGRKMESEHVVADAHLWDLL
ncbi:hypothetical protein CcaverHIS002_0702440 [Cutaneotrichosporon cavernicola]|uniref:Uncharacterized protein n=1 Tax=Cutaneotrichosporon cavernicola TaxID=279322 RepID=A0AA48LA17_9TREE|nr:uncharacterized protein CcaverHIS019_0702530 [Cutaneotrichosporon cavernicola]BEI86898.1 hypothetical protein CcaverHIS002_0702440 [Cutaneotrichosporon cavernicola]BEI94672.1 hypothetical protein CcaverHIS019_0702530 [Cutaneotrichosporon cavernicola]BEJ02447.1 hypothetical protein CcaverHIS631_0702420 [Cutaneotrichosporon cavernicola]BEJ10206.1 hypothetical protein CcaverHIS641_0702410 [Cutaneotrichosporon cavernicola]